MCGIVGYIGKEQALPILMNGLKCLEYRGYDSAGVAILNGGKISVERASGRSLRSRRSSRDMISQGRWV